MRSDTWIVAIAILAIGCGLSDGTPAGSGGSGDPGVPETVADILRILSENNNYPLVGAEAYVNAGGRAYRFRLQWVGASEDNMLDSGLLLGGCGIARVLTDDLMSLRGWTVTADFAETWPRQNGNRFSFWTPDLFPVPAATGDRNDLNEPVVGAGVQWGLFDHATGEEWSVVPDGKSFVTCEQSTQPTSNEPVDVYTCQIGWFGVVSENLDPEKSAGAALVTCTFASPDSDYVQCLRDGCDDQNPCTHDYCSPGGGCSHVPIERSTQPVLEILEEVARYCDAGGSRGRCEEGMCVEDPCGGRCHEEVAYDPESDMCWFERCKDFVDPPTCDVIRNVNCSAPWPNN